MKSVTTIEKDISAAGVLTFRRCGLKNTFELFYEHDLLFDRSSSLLASTYH